MFLEGCQAKLGCSIVLSGDDMEELKIVRKALKKCLMTARVLILEREYLRFISPDMEMFRKTEQEIEKDNDEPEVIITGGQSEENKGGEFAET